MKRFFAVLLAVTLIFAVFGSAFSVFADENIGDNLINVTSGNTYRDYIAKHNAEAVGKNFEADLSVESVLSVEGDVTVTDNGIEFKSEESSAEIKLSVEADGNYMVNLCFTPTTKGNYTNSIYGIKVNGEYPFDEARELTLSFRWKGGEVTTDSRGNEIVGSMTCVYDKTENYIVDPSGRQNAPLMLNLKKGENTVTFVSRTGNITLNQIKFETKTAEKPYEEVKNSYNASATSGQNILLEAEDYFEATSTTLSPDYDKSSALTSPNDSRKLLYNYIPGSKYTTSGQALIWEFTPDESGLYRISIRARQNTKSGFSVSRRLYINGEVPFDEMNEIKFDYKGNWYVKTLGEEEPFEFYFEKGKTYTLKLEVTIGSLCDLTNRVDDTVYALNSLYRSIIMVVGNDPDKYRDYQLATRIPDFMETVEAISHELDEIVSELETLNAGRSGSTLSSFHSLINRLGKIKEDPDLAARTLGSLKSDIQGLSAWNQDAKAQPLDIDYVRVHSADVKAGKDEANFFSQLWFDIKRIVLSFAEDYGVVGDIYDEASSIEVWMTAGRDQMNIVKKMVDNTFIKDYGINANVSLVTVDIRSAILAGTAPDLSLFLSGDMPVNLALRDSVVDLTQFEGYEKVAERFLPHSIKPFEYNGGVYALPISESFNMLFVRTDIFEELELTAPETWDDFYEVSTILQRNNLEVGIPSNIGMFATLLLQNGGNFYNEELNQTAFGSDAAISAFDTWTGLFAQYGFPLTYDFYNRFSSGEMPMAITNYTEYLRLKVASPELSGRWEMCLIPGVLQADGTIDRSLSISGATGADTSPGLSQSVSSAAIFSLSDKKEEAFKFLDWFTSEESQSKYGREIEDTLGMISRYTSSNINSFRSLPWSIEERNLLEEQRGWIRSINEISGNYSVTRELISAFRKVVYENANPTDTIYTYNKKINKELERKNK